MIDEDLKKLWIKDQEIQRQIARVMIMVSKPFKIVKQKVGEDDH